MTHKDPYQIVIRQHVTEKSRTLQELKTNTSNPSVSRCEAPKYVFIVHPKATKREIARAVEYIYSTNGIKVVAVNTINIKGKVKRRRGRISVMPSIKKAVVTLEKGDSLEQV